MVLVYTRNNCAACKGTEAFLERSGIPFTEVNVEENLELAQALVDEGWRAMPVVKSPIGSWAGNNPTKLRELAATYK